MVEFLSSKLPTNFIPMLVRFEAEIFSSTFSLKKDLKAKAVDNNVQCLQLKKQTIG